jgi:PTH1 family peptidyl-tRNA hydrolase
LSGQPWLVVGLGNPGPSFAATRHNVGRVVVELLAERGGGSFKAHRRCRADVVETRLGGAPGTRAVLARARSYKNGSAGPVASLRDFFDLTFITGGDPALV